MSKRYFEHLHSEISVAVGRRVSRYDLWLAVWGTGADPDDLDSKQIETFLEDELEAFLREEGVQLAPRAHRRLQRALRRFNPRHPTPEEWLTRFLERAEIAV